MLHQNLWNFRCKQFINAKIFAITRKKVKEYCRISSFLTQLVRKFALRNRTVFNFFGYSRQGKVIMSEIIKEVFINYIACAVLGGVLEYLTPDKMRKTLRGVVVSLMLVLSLSPLLKADFDFSNIDIEERREQEEMNSLMHIANLTEKKIYDEMRDILINSGVSEYEIYVTATPSREDNTVYLEEIKIQVGAEYRNKTEEIKARVSEEYQSILKVGVENE